MQKDNKFFDDVAKLAQSAAGNIFELKRDLEQLISAKVENLLSKLNYSTREEMDTALSMLTKIREEQENLKKRLDALEKHLSS
jgi:BMFP domain-containing protein YqiC